MDAASSSIETQSARVADDGMQADLTLTRAQVTQVAVAKAAALNALQAVKAVVADHDKKLEAAQRQVSTLSADLAAARRETKQATEMAQRLRSERAAVEGTLSRIQGAKSPSADWSAQANKRPSKVFNPTSSASGDPLVPDLPQGASARVVVLYSLKSETVRMRAIALTSALIKSGTDVADIVGVPRNRAGNHVTYYYRQDQDMAKTISSKLSVPEPSQSHIPTDKTPRPGTIEVSVGG